MSDICTFCEIALGLSPATIVEQWPDAICIVPLDPVTPGHLLVIPRRHVRDAKECPSVTALAFGRAAVICPASCNLIASVGAAATQTVGHLHVHIVPRHHGDGLSLPWTGQKRTEAPA